MSVQAFIPEAAVERLYQGVISWFSRPGKVQDNPVLVGPFVQCLRDEFAAIINLVSLSA